MTVSYTAAKVIYEGNGQTIQWDIPFPYLSESDVQLFLIHADGTETALTSDFTIDPDLHAVLYPMSGSQTPPLPAGEKLMILRRTALAQQTEFEAQQAFDPFLLEEGYDKAMMIAQEQAEEIARAIKFPASCTAAQTNAQSYLSQITSGVAAAQLSVQAAQTSASNAAQSAEDASDEADRSAWNADNAQQAQINAAVSYNQAKQFAESASSSAASALSKASEAQTAAAAAQTSLTSAQASAQAAAASAQEAQNAVQTHNTNAQAHSDIRTTLSGKAEQTALSAHMARTDNPHAVTKAQVGLGNVDNTSDTDKPVSAAVQAALDLKANSADVDADISDINAALARKEDDEEFYPADYNWPDIRPAARPNSIVLLAGVKTDYSAYDNLGFAATCEGGYNVFIDGVQYGDTYASGAQCSITWSQYSATAGFSVTKPQALSAHIVQIVPAGGNNITAFACKRVVASGMEQQGVLWAHFNISNAIALADSFYYFGVFNMPLLTAVTAKEDMLKILSMGSAFGSTPLAYIAQIDGSGASASSLSFPFNGNNGNLSKVRLKNFPSSVYFRGTFSGKSGLKKIKSEGCALSLHSSDEVFRGCAALSEIPVFDWSGCITAKTFLTGAQNIQPFVLDLGYANVLTAFGITNTPNFKGLLVSPQAPFTGSSPQINVSYTGLDQAALVALFNSLPTVTAGQVINVTGAVGAASLTAEQLAIATNKGWTVTR